MTLFPKTLKPVKRNRAAGLTLLAASFVIQVVPPVLQAWARVTGTSESTVLAVLGVVYVVLVAIVLSRERAAS